MLSVFDLDHTLLRINVSYCFCLYLYRKKILSLIDVAFAAFYYIRHRYLKLSFLDYHSKLFERLLKGKSLNLLNEQADQFIEEILPSYLYPPAFSALKQAEYTMILSSSPDFLVGKIAKKLGVDKYRATQYLVDKDQKLCKISSVMHGDFKAKAIMGENGEVAAYSDSILDLPMLLCAKKPVAVNPDRKLKTFALKNGWLII